MKILNTTLCLALIGGLGCDDADSSAVDAAPQIAADGASLGDSTVGDAIVSDGSASDASTTPDAAIAPDGTTLEDFVAEADDFECLQGWTKVRKFYIQNTLGHLEEAVAIASGEDGGRFPVGTIIQLIPNEAMVKRGAGFSAQSNDWEFFALTTAGGQTTIDARGTDDVVNQFGGNCMGCHSAAEPQWDFLCEEDHGCAPIGAPAGLIEALQNGDPRCR